MALVRGSEEHIVYPWRVISPSCVLSKVAGQRPRDPRGVASDQPSLRHFPFLMVLSASAPNLAPIPSRHAVKVER